MPKTRVLQYTKCEADGDGPAHHFFLHFRPGQVREAGLAIDRWVAHPELPLDWNDAALLRHLAAQPPEPSKESEAMLELEALARRLEAAGYYPTLSRRQGDWTCTLFNDRLAGTPPSGSGPTALAALQAADACRGELAADPARVKR